MRREIRTMLAAVAVALPMALASIPGIAHGGVIVTDLKTGRPAEIYSSWAALQTASYVTEGGSSGGSSSSDDGQGKGAPPKKPHDPRDPVMLLGASEYDQIEQGLITYDEAMSGCGGAQVAGGDAGLGALALVGLFLALRRRK